MKKLLVLVLFVISLATVSAQIKKDPFDKPSVQDGIIRHETSNNFLGFFNPANFSMSHSINLSYSAFGGNGIATSVYTNTMSYKFADNLRLSADVSFVHSPYSTFGDKFSKDISGIFLSRAELNFKPWENAEIMIQYRNIPAYQMMDYGYYNSFYGNPWYGYRP